MSEKSKVSAATMRRAGMVVDAIGVPLQAVMKPTRNLGFPYRAPTVPRGVDVPKEPTRLGSDFDTDWARRAPARAARTVLSRGPLQLMVKLIADPEVLGTDRLSDLIALGDDAPAVIFAPNHHSHVDTPIMVTSVPEPWRSKLVVAAAADYFFDTRAKGTMAALTLNALPIDREVTSRKSSDLIRDLVDDGWSLVIYPEGGRSPDGWGQEFKGGAAYLSNRTGAPVVPVFIDGSGAIFGKGMKRPKPGSTRVVFGAPLHPIEGESTRRFNARIEAAVAALGDEALTDFWTARKNAAAKTSPKLTGPSYSGWRRQWALSEQRKLGAAGMRRRQKRRWPDLG
ncbi:MAG: lysophospholipid acyltransferase family protein [Ilumatobacteraceae bacterium]